LYFEKWEKKWWNFLMNFLSSCASSSLLTEECYL
jgi:hypothetical protein